MMVMIMTILMVGRDDDAAVALDTVCVCFKGLGLNFANFKESLRLDAIVCGIKDHVSIYSEEYARLPAFTCVTTYFVICGHIKVDCG